MASRLVAGLIAKGVFKMLEVIRKGRIVPTILGGIVGGGIGACSGFLFLAIMPAMTALGIFGGATMAAAIFPSPKAPPGARETDLEPFKLGQIIQTWSFQQGEHGCLTVGLNNALYVVSGEKIPYEDVLRLLAAGEDPDLANADLIRLDELDRIEMAKPDSTELTFIHSVGGRTKQRIANFLTKEDRDQMIFVLREILKKPLSWTEHSYDLARAMRTPVILATVLAVFFSAVACLSAFWRANPPAPPVGKPGPDPLVKFLTDAGPRGVLLVGVLVVMLAVGWLAVRVVRPPRYQIMAIRDGMFVMS
jgi:hypothetical protein